MCYPSFMSTIIELEKQILALPAVEREKLAMLTWESLIGDPAVTDARTTDPEGVEIALQRDNEIESGATQPIGHAEFLRRTGGVSR